VLIEELKAKFDYVVIDTPPAGLLSDSIYLMQYIDTTIFVLNAASSTKKVVKFVENIVVDNKIKNLFFVLNGVTKSMKRYYYQGYGYGYGYGGNKSGKANS
jgi:Mrp family chromosome partitioning ATPase